MKIKSLRIEGLHDAEQTLELTFNEDVNILTGPNGSGKTTVLKILWYLISANIERAVREIRFRKIEIETEPYKLTIERSYNKEREMVSFTVHSPDGSVLFDKKELWRREQAVEDANQVTVELLNESIFFPTFRRIEGGFSMNPTERGHRGRRIIHSIIHSSGEQYFSHGHGFGSDIQKAIANHAGALSVGGHRFVSSISTVDVQQLVTQRHNNATNRVEVRSKSLSENIVREIRNYKSENPTFPKNAEKTLNKIHQDVENFESLRDSEFKSLNVLSEVVDKIFNHKGIKLSSRFTFGEVANSISSDSLSAGEKQMLSFLCYNAFYNGCPFFIDEPELSLHVDWQRMLLDVMLEQSSNNQYFIATHSPFIYTQFEDKEIQVNVDRSDSFNAQ